MAFGIFVLVLLLFGTVLHLLDIILKLLRRRG